VVCRKDGGCVRHPGEEEPEHCLQTHMTKKSRHKDLVLPKGDAETADYYGAPHALRLMDALALQFNPVACVLGTAAKND
jgi:hypothetical protein